MAPSKIRRGKQPPKIRNEARTLKRKRNEESISKLIERVSELDPSDEIKSFSDLPLSQPTALGLETSHFKALTDIQCKAIPLALKGKDCLGAAKTGSGKTLAFLVPVLENLYRQKWSDTDGLGALILSPTRELAIQTFDVLRKIGRYHTFSAGLLIGGKSLQEEKERLGRMNILVCTPGRLLQHMDQTATLEVGNLQMMVLDEADRILDMGFQRDVDAIIEHVPKERQTLLFSATQTKKVSDLARLSLQEPEYVSVHESAASATPSTLQQHYVLTPLPEKLNTLYSFIKANLKAKILVFVSSGKQVRFIYEAFRHLQPGIPLMHLHGRQKQTARLDITTKFSSSKYSCLIATDVVARGLDFPAVDWVLQLDCPEDADTYIHRVGRTARYERNGRAILFLDPSEEEGMLKRLEHKKVPIEKINVREKKQQSVKNQLQDMCFKDPEIKYLGQKAFSSYARSIHLQKDKDIFKIDKLQLEEFAASLGLPGAPKIKFLKGDNAKELKNAPRHLASSSEDDDEEDDADNKKVMKKKPEVRTKYDRMFERRNQNVLAEHYAKMVGDDNDQPNHHDDADEDNDFLTPKRRLDVENDSEEEAPDEHPKLKVKAIQSLGSTPIIIDSKRREKLLKSKKKLLKLKGRGTKLVFDDDGNPHEIYELEDEEQFRQRGTAESQRARFLDGEKERVQEADLADKQLAKEKKRERREKKKARQAAERQEDEEAEEEAGGVQGELVPINVEEAAEETDAEKPRKRAKKWFEDDSDGERAGKRAKEKPSPFMLEEPETLEDLEALAVGLLD
ncbi:MAG: ATP-dependent RNA helicase dbp4 [Trizodia sp. TS-e1964]|nr:MAG: ATP-dependent RNA helicase dbp4 [Trizodia sp. TS-e1964]